MKISEVKEWIMIGVSEKVPIHLWGPPGVGKSDMVRQVAKSLGRDVIDLRMSLLNPVDLRGIPVAKDGVTSWWAPSFLPRMGNPFLFLDELNVAPPASQSAAYQLVLDRKVGEYKLPDEVDILAAGNRGTDRALVNQMPSPLRNRFMHLDVDPDLNDWKDWALNNGIDPLITSFLTLKSDRLFFFDPAVHTKGFPTPRSWAFTSKILNGVGVDKASRSAVAIGGLLGEGVATEFCGFLKVAGSLPNAEKVILEGEMDVTVPKEPASRYAFCGALVGVTIRAKMSLSAVKNLSKFCRDKLPSDFAVLAMKDYARTQFFKDMYQKIIETKEWKHYCEAYGPYIMQ